MPVRFSFAVNCFARTAAIFLFPRSMRMTSAAVTASMMLLGGALDAADAPVSAKVLARYEQMLAANPVEGIPLERLWEASVEAGQTGQLLARYEASETFAGRMIYGHLLKRVGRMEEAQAAYERAANLDANNVLAPLALGELHMQNARPRFAAEWLQKAAALLDPNDPRTTETALRIGSAWLAAGDVEAAVNSWEKTAAAAPANLELR
jgi:tetratricopeptide (TPR) repeat protein